MGIHSVMKKEVKNLNSFLEKLKKRLTLSNLLYLFSILFAAGVMLKTYLDRKSLPPDVCPIDNNNILIYSAIIILILTMILTTFLDRKKKGDKEND